MVANPEALIKELEEKVVLLKGKVKQLEKELKSLKGVRAKL